jgi:hypothetical protein
MVPVVCDLHVARRANIERISGQSVEPEPLVSTVIFELGPKRHDFSTPGRIATSWSCASFCSFVSGPLNSPRL